MAGLDAAIEKKEAENRAANVKVNQVVAVDSPQLPELPNAEIERKESLQILFCPPIWKPPDAESRVVTSPTPPKPSESFESHLATTQGGFIGSFHSSLKQKEQPPPKPPDFYFNAFSVALSILCSKSMLLSLMPPISS
ncbi:hypothetical protein L195_g042764 [Trifolium pratense]|uniref:Uncharacterized protein n=1 Tax=Trifolium pratense TaxID=57577 RepID=A0A2K3M7E2_TRIPR|nr:hypothetical protein L195_g042764 [Trifolium pratense]